MKSKNTKAEEVKLTPFEQFEADAKKVLSQTKAESDKQLNRFQANNAKRRAKKRG